MSALLLPPNSVSNVVKKQEQCWCEYHKGAIVTQVEADLPNGVHFVIVIDDYYRLSIDGSPLSIVKPEQIEGRLMEAMSGD